jgi:hypothetical protein
LISIGDVAAKISSRIEGWPLGNPRFGDPRYISHRLSLSGFQMLDPFDDGRSICFVDGGNLPIISTPGLVVHLSRVGFCVYKSNERCESPNLPSKIDFITIAASEGSGNEITYSAEITPLEASKRDLLPDDDDLVFDSFDRTLMDGRQRASLTRVATAARVFAEWRLASVLSEEVLNSGDIIVRDGSLQTQITGESEYANDAYGAALGNEVLFTGLAKTSTLFTDTGMPLFSAISILANRNELGERSWVYHPIVDIMAPDHRAEMYGVKLHPQSRHVFRFEILKNQAEALGDEAMRVIAVLASNSSDLAFPGYPYGLIEADRISRVREEEIESLEVQLLSSLSALGSWPSLEAFIRTVDAHTIIDGI